MILFYLELSFTNQFAISMKVKRLEKAGILAIKLLRQDKFNKGLPFMINSKALPSDQCYLEYPDGKIELVALSRKDNDFKVIYHFSSEEGYDIKKKYSLD